MRGIANVIGAPNGNEKAQAVSFIEFTHNENRILSLGSHEGHFEMDDGKIKMGIKKHAEIALPRPMTDKEAGRHIAEEHETFYKNFMNPEEESDDTNLDPSEYPEVPNPKKILLGYHLPNGEPSPFAEPVESDRPGREEKMWVEGAAAMASILTYDSFDTGEEFTRYATETRVLKDGLNELTDSPEEYEYLKKHFERVFTDRNPTV